MYVWLVGLIPWQCYVRIFVLFYSLLNSHSILPQTSPKILERFRERVEFYIAHDNKQFSLGRGKIRHTCLSSLDLQDRRDSWCRTNGTNRKGSEFPFEKSKTPLRFEHKGLP